MISANSREGKRSRPAEDAAGPPSRLAGIIESILRSPIGGRQDTEHEVAIGRIAFFAAVSIFFVLQGKSSWVGIWSLPALVCLCALGVSGCILLNIAREPDVSEPRRYGGIVFDQLMLCAILFVTGAMGMWFLPCFLMVSVGASLRFGWRHGCVASVVGAAGFYIVYLTDYSFWHNASNLVGVSLVSMLVVPAYAAALGRRLEHLSQSYRNKARKLTRVALEDALTGLANRAMFRRQLERAMQHARSGDDAKGFAILYCDLDGFKSVNDTHGHHVGDVLLKQVAKALSACVRGSDTVGRMGGDEFAILLTGISDVEIARRIGAQVVQRVRAIERVDGRTIRVSCSVGITLVAAPLDEHDQLDSILKRADDAMYQAKRAGKNQFYLQWANA